MDVMSALHVMQDYTTCGWSLLLTKSKTIQVRTACARAVASKPAELAPKLMHQGHRPVSEPAGGPFYQSVAAGGCALSSSDTCPRKNALCSRCAAQIDKNSITIGGCQQYHCIVMSDFLLALSGELLSACPHRPKHGVCPAKWPVLVLCVTCCVR